MKKLIPILLVITAGVLAYGNSLNGEFLLDDKSLVEDNLYIRNWDNIGKIFSGEVTTDKVVGGVTFYRPVQIFTYFVDHLCGD
jgi:hypothetical protein